MTLFPRMYRAILLLVLSAIFSIHIAIAQTSPGVLISRFPFKQYYGGVVVVQAQLKGIPDTLQFILDTGSAGISLDTNTCLRLGIPLTPTEKVVRGVGGSKKVSFALNHTLLLPGVEVD